MLDLGRLAREQAADLGDPVVERLERVRPREIERDERPLRAGELRELAQIDVFKHGFLPR
jgi:hypothetical protein